MLLQYYIWRESYSRLFPPPCPAISCHLPEKTIFGHLPPFAPAYGRPLDPTSTLINKNVSTGCYCNNIYREKAIPGCFHPFVPPFPAICLKIQFLTIYLHLHTPMGSPCHFFIFFMMGCVGWHIFLLISSEKLEIFSFLFIFFHYFCPFFRKNFFRPIYPHLTPPMSFFIFF